MPPGAAVVVSGDSEFGPLQALLESWGWFYVLRQKGSHLLRLTAVHPWQRCDTLVSHPGERLWLTNIQTLKKPLIPLQLQLPERSGKFTNLRYLPNNSAWLPVLVSCNSSSTIR